MPKWTDFLNLGESYVKEQLKDLRKFVLIAVEIDPALLNIEDLKRITKVAMKWVLQHGTPTKAKVKKALGIE